MTEKTKAKYCVECGSQNLVQVATERFEEAEGLWIDIGVYECSNCFNVFGIVETQGQYIGVEDFLITDEASVDANQVVEDDVYITANEIQEFADNAKCNCENCTCNTEQKVSVEESTSTIDTFQQEYQCSWSDSSYESTSDSSVAISDDGNTLNFSCDVSCSCDSGSDGGSYGE